MNLPTLEIKMNSAELEFEEVSRPLVLEDEEKVGPMNGRTFTVLLRDEKGAVKGGGKGVTVWNWVFIAQLWVARDCRGKGHGRDIVGALEKQSRLLNCQGAYLATFDFQALDFYKKMGYEVFGTVDQFPQGHQLYFLKKKLA